MSILKFSVFADLHYKKGMYAVTVSDMESIVNRANDNKVDFMIHAGDLCNDYLGSPELIGRYLNNEYHIPTYGIYGNHELESNENSMELVTPLLTNDKNVIWGTEDGKIGDGSIGYYYFDKDEYRIVCTDTNYSYNETLSQWEHNKTASWGAPSGNKFIHSLGAKQLTWLEKVLTDAARQGKSCVLMSHAGFNIEWHMSQDANIVQKIIKRVNELRPRTIILCINGHYHTNHLTVKDNVVYFDVNAVINGSWMSKNSQHYSEKHYFTLENYDKNGLKCGEKEIPLNNLWQSKNTHYFANPLSAIVKITDNRVIEVEGSRTTWRYDVVPNNSNEACTPEISSTIFELK